MFEILENQKILENDVRVIMVPERGELAGRPAGGRRASDPGHRPPLRGEVFAAGECARSAGGKH